MRNRNRNMCALGAGALCALQVWGAAVPADIREEAGGFVVTRPAQHAALQVTFRTGDRSDARIVIRREDGSARRLILKNLSDTVSNRVKRGGKVEIRNLDLPDAKIRFDPLVTRHVRPRLQRYTEEQQQALAARWESLVPASQARLTLTARQRGDACELYLDGQYIGNDPGVVRALAFTLPPAGGILGAETFSPEDDARYVPLDLRWIARPGVFSNAVVSPAPGLRDIGGVPVRVASGEASGDVGVVRQMKGSWALECDEHLSRTALDGMPETLHFAVPPAFYTRAWALCAVDPAPALDPVLSVRMTRYAKSGRGGAISLDTVRLPRKTGEALPETVRLAGEITVHGTNLPLYLVSLDLKPGEILDLLQSTNDVHASMMGAPYLDIDFLGKPGGLGAQWDSRKKPDRHSVSGVHLFGVTLEKMPVSLRLEPRQPGNIFHNAETPETVARLRAEAPNAAAVLRWTLLDAEGRAVRRRRKRLAFGAAGEEVAVTLPLDTDTLGHFGLRIEMAARDGRVWLTHDAAFARLGSDTRRAGYESPFGTWWFGGAHYSGGEPEIAGPMLYKAGLRKTTFGWTPLSEKDFEPWKVTLNQIGWVGLKDITNRAAAYAELDAKIAEKAARFPHCDAADIFHESYRHYLPPELVGEKPEETPEEREKARNRVAIAHFVAQYYREKYPHIRLLVGNTSSSASLIASLLRHGLRRDAIDAIGIEAVGQTSMPEKLWLGGLQGIWLAREAARRFGHEIPVDGCYEFTARADRNLGEQRQAEFYVRDILISLAYGFSRVSPGIIMDAGNAYYNTLWGGGGLCRRYPLLYPKKAYVGVATVTRVLDRAVFSRRVETGSRTVYALAFRRADGREVTALWTTVGTAEIEARFDGVASLEEVGFFGESGAARARSRTVTAGTAPVYLLSDRPVASAPVKARRYAPPPRGFRASDSMAEPGAWREDPANNALEERDPELPYRQRGTFAVRPVRDKDKCDCLEVALVKTGKREPLISEVTCLVPRTPLAAAGRPVGIGLWVRGDSGWGKIVFEIEDANRTVWRTEGRWHDWPADLAIHFDGWRFVSYPIDHDEEALNLSPGRHWIGGKGVPVFPVTLRAVHVMVNRQALDVTEMREAPAVLRLKDIGFLYAQ